MLWRATVLISNEEKSSSRFGPLFCFDWRLLEQKGEHKERKEEENGNKTWNLTLILFKKTRKNDSVSYRDSISDLGAKCVRIQI